MKRAALFAVLLSAAALSADTVIEEIVARVNNSIITRTELQHEFKSLEGRLGKAMVFVTHDVREGLLLGTRVGVMQAGRLVFLGTPEELRRSAHPEVRAFLEAVA